MIQTLALCLVLQLSIHLNVWWDLLIVHIFRTIRNDGTYMNIKWIHQLQLGTNILIMFLLVLLYSLNLNRTLTLRVRWLAFELRHVSVAPDIWYDNGNGLISIHWTWRILRADDERYTKKCTKICLLSTSSDEFKCKAKIGLYHINGWQLLEFLMRISILQWVFHCPFEKKDQNTFYLFHVSNVIRYYRMDGKYNENRWIKPNEWNSLPAFTQKHFIVITAANLNKS